MQKLIRSEMSETNSSESVEKSSSGDNAESSKPIPLDQSKPRELKAGWAWNPLLTYPRNKPCPCRSGKKFKVCHLNMLPRVIPEKLAKGHREQMNRPDLVFITKNNAKEVLEDANSQAVADKELSR